MRSSSLPRPSSLNHTNAAPVRTAPPEVGLYRRLRGYAGRARRALARAHDGARHPGRRRRARQQIASLAPPERVIFLCLGNVCRSPYAEHRFRALAEARRGAEVGAFSVVSRGFIGPGRAPADLALAEALRRGVDTTDHRSRVISDEDLDAADLVVLVDAAHGRRLRRDFRPKSASTVVLGDLDPLDVDRRTIRDPWGQDPEVFEQVFDRLDRCLIELADLLFGPEPGTR